MSRTSASSRLPRSIARVVGLIAASAVIAGTAMAKDDKADKKAKAGADGASTMAVKTAPGRGNPGSTRMGGMDGMTYKTERRSAPIRSDASTKAIKQAPNHKVKKAGEK